MGGAGAGKSAVTRTVAASRPDVRLIDMDERIYGFWGDRWSRDRHPAAVAWLTSADPLALQLAMPPHAFLAFQEALSAEALDLLADELDAAPDDWLLVDGGFGSLRTLTETVPASWVVCLVADDIDPARLWQSDPGRRAFLDVVASVEAVDAPVERFLALDRAMAERMLADAEASGAALVRWRDGEPLEATAARVSASLGIAVA